MAVTEHWVASQHQNHNIAFARFAGEAWLLDGRGVAYWPKTDTLVVSDLHFEKGSYLYSRGNPLPALDTVATIKRLSQIVSDYQPSRVISLGDSFHDRQSVARMNESDKTRLFSLINSVPDWVWVEGNHDPELPEILPGSACHSLKDSHLTFRHEPAQSEAVQIIGHYHPKTMKQLARRRFSGKCFVLTPSLMIMPAFGQYTGGLSVDDEVLLALAPATNRQCYLVYDGRVVKC
ncbi:ligase-associated DNA damage response endonuclease PdeM [Alteromonas sp. CYL-A6]|uniref:ligase-associated DNA damage response endonuclease PdeM n=1 Tax=Alteromonas nitratireducens TaxID=3390813 RepID=UPI0034C4F053